MNNDEISEIFNKWNNLKIRIHKSERFLYPKAREIWWVNLGQNIGVEVSGKNHGFERPVVVIKIFNKYGALVAPTTSKMKDDKNFVYFLNGKSIPNAVNMAQTRSVSLKRFIRKIEDMNISDFERVKAKLLSFLI
ncbi:MAG: type II toxin-antitoxin system PemK/MazF family toxin [bacterium]